MKTTFEIPDAIFRKAKANAAARGIPLRELFTEAIKDKLEAPASDDKPWLKSFGGLRHLHKENLRM